MKHATKGDSPRPVALIGMALVGGAITFAAVVTAIPFVSPPGTGAAGADASLVGTLSLVHAGLVAAALFMLTFLPTRSAADAGEDGLATRAIMRWALIEGAALFGCVVVLLGSLGNVLPDQPIYYANLASVLVLVVVVLLDLGKIADERRRV